MSNHTTDASSVADVEDYVEIRADITEHDGRPAECTLWPRNASGDALLTEWIVAREGSFVPLDEMR